ncbi:MAG: phosphatase PAP2 family protein [Bacteroidota bacterium]
MNKKQGNLSLNPCLSREMVPFFATMLIYQLLLAALVMIYGYEGSFLLLNGFHSKGLDAPMFLLTHLGDALILTSMLGILLVKKDPGLIVLLILVVIITGLTGQLMKNFLFDSWDRPLGMIGDDGNLHIVYDYRLYRNSFPSGHSITVAAALTSMAMVLKPRFWAMVMLAIATSLISYTRIYVGVHFAGDVLAGTIIGVAGAIFLTVRLYPGITQWVSRLSLSGLKRLKTGLFVLALAGLAGGILMIGKYLKMM